jgi:hypothetical protein
MKGFGRGKVLVGGEHREELPGSLVRGHCGGRPTHCEARYQHRDGLLGFRAVCGDGSHGCC